MTFIWPLMLIALAAVPLAALLYLRMERRRAAALERLGDLGMWRGPSGQGAGPRRHFPPALYVRESRRMRGLYVLRQHDILEDSTKPDPIAVSSFPIDSSIS